MADQADGFRTTVVRGSKQWQFRSIGVLRATPLLSVQFEESRFCPATTCAGPGPYPSQLLTGLVVGDAGSARIGALWYCEYQPSCHPLTAYERILLFPKRPVFWSGIVYVIDIRNWWGRSSAERSLPSPRLNGSGEVVSARFFEYI